MYGALKFPESVSRPFRVWCGSAGRKCEGFCGLILAAGFLSVGLRVAGAEQVTFQKEGVAEIHCKCVIGAPGCELKVVADLAGAHEWHDSLSVRRGTKMNLKRFCYQRKEVRGRGDGLCCEIFGRSEESAERFFAGAVRKEPQ
jgi:hypothetical protein